MKKKGLLFFLVLVMVTALFIGCSGDKADETETPETTQGAETGEDIDETEDQAGEAGEEGAALKIAIVSSPSGVDDGSFNQDNYNGI